MSRLFVVATPIGNLKDITIRAIETLKEVNFIACEDTRNTSFLLSAYEIKKELFVLNAANENNKINHVLKKIKNGETCALVTDAGTPCISDPGIRLVNAAVKEEIEIVGIPGANAAITALSIAGLPTDSFTFEGFIPQKKGRQKKLKELTEEQRTIVIYESTYRIKKLLEELNEYMPQRAVAVCRELTKKFEEVWRGTPKDILENFDEKISKGEFVIIIAPIGWKTN